ncbi:cupin domain-containing protein [Halobium salinum]|uniref:Cupin domain-containing protein n=1 Tax=Halobium salinum TaxID=1364940 RepID=A0ABD5P8A9_9EURY|nr:cupin domain-containing protein [Halobium salinum]
MRRQVLDEMESRMGPASVVRPLTDALGLTDVALNYYELDPEESFAYGFHAHAEQEEAFYVTQGTVTFETEAGEVEVGPGELVSFAPGEFQRGVNRGEERVHALAIGAPQETGGSVVIRECPTCGEGTEQSIALTDQQDAVVAVCEECGTETGRFD